MGFPGTAQAVSGTAAFFEKNPRLTRGAARNVYSVAKIGWTFCPV